MMSRFLIYLGTEALPDSYEDLDDRLADYLEAIFHDGEPKSWANATVAAVEHFLHHSRRRLPFSWRLVGTWNRIEGPTRAPPFPRIVVLGLAGFGVMIDRVDFSLAMLTGFHALLRAGEASGALCGCFTLDQEDGCGVLHLGYTKGGVRRGAPEGVTLDDPFLVAALAVHLRSRLPGDTLFRGSQQQFRTLLSRALDIFGIGHLGFLPGSLRRGGATFDFRTHGQLSRVTVRGRWEQSRTARLYINEGVAMLGEMSLPTNAVNALNLCVRRLPELTASRGVVER